MLSSEEEQETRTEERACAESHSNTLRKFTKQGGGVQATQKPRPGVDSDDRVLRLLESDGLETEDDPALRLTRGLE